MVESTASFEIETRESQQCIEITSRVAEFVKGSGVAEGLCHVMVLHSTAAITVNEIADPNIGLDVIDALGRLVPERADWRHDRIDDNAHSHIKASLMGPSETLVVSKGELLLGTWQAILLYEFDGPRTRKVSLRLLS